MISEELIIKDITSISEKLVNLPKFFEVYFCHENICYYPVDKDQFVKVEIIEPAGLRLAPFSVVTVEFVGYTVDRLLAKLHSHLWEKNKVVNIDLLHYDGRNISLWTEYEFVCRICGKRKTRGLVEFKTSRDLFEPFDAFIGRTIEEVERYCKSINAPSDLVVKVVEKIKKLQPIIHVYYDEWNRLVEYALKVKEKEGINILEYRGEYVDLVYNRHIVRLSNGEEIVLLEDKHAYVDSCGVYRRFMLEKGSEKSALIALGLLKHYDKI